MSTPAPTPGRVANPSHIGAAGLAPHALPGAATERAPRRWVRMFIPRMAELVLAGVKRQTVRPLPRDGRLPKPGDILDARMWSGVPYRSKQVVIGEFVYEGVWQVCITGRALTLSGPAVRGIAAPGLRSFDLTPEPLEAFAVADGFVSWFQFADWFRNKHGLPFSGCVHFFK